MSSSAAQSHSSEPRERTAEERTTAARVTPLNRYPTVSSTPDPDRKRRLPTVLLVLGLLLAAAGATYVARKGANQGAADAAAQAAVPPLELARVDVETLEPRSLTRTLSLSGSIAPLVQVNVKAKGGG
jgi:hypothetical protein